MLLILRPAGGATTPVSLSFTGTGTPSVTRGISKSLSVSATASPALARSVSKAFSVSATGTVSFTKGLLYTLSASITATGTAAVTLVKTFRRSASIAATGTGALARTAAFRVSSSVTATGTLTIAKRIAKGAISVVATGTAALVRRVGVTKTIVAQGVPSVTEGLLFRVTKSVTSTAAVSSVQNFIAKPVTQVVTRLKIRNLMQTLVRNVIK